MIRKFLLVYAVPALAAFLVTFSVQAAQIGVIGQHTRSDGSIYDFEVVDGDALSPGDRFQIIIDSDRNIFYSVIEDTSLL